MFGYTLGAEGDDLSFDERDSAPFMPKCVVVDPNFDWKGQPRSRGVPWDRTIIYEAHVRGFTKLHPAVPRRAARHLRGTGQPGRSIDYVRSLGVTSIELLPIHTFINDSQLLEKRPHQLLGLQQHRLLRARSRAMPRSRSSACANSRRWWRASTTPGWR